MKKILCLLWLWLASVFSTQTQAAVGDIGTFTSSARTFSTASYWIEGVDSVIMIDTQFLPKEAIEAVEAAQKATGKEVMTAIVLHPNPDKVNGTKILQKRGINVITSDSVAQLIPEVHAIRWEWFGKEYAPDYPQEAAQPSRFGNQTTVVSLAGLPLTLHVLGKGASDAHVVVQHRDQVFVGDLINPNNHAWLELGTIGDWLERLTQINEMKPRRVYAGR
jgi:glyoxylase-like metal-dependent hydrolase (beta-lactamase superfamily II)